MKTTALQRLLAWLLIAMLGSPPWSAWARDTDIYRSVVTASSAAEPNVLLMLDTSDSMNLPEGWREYPGGYDSHVEYLWNDFSAIDFFGCPLNLTGGIYLSCGRPNSPAPDATTPMGYWAGSTLAARQALWSAARAYAWASEPGDDGQRYIFRNYKERNALYWLPAGTPESDKRLYSNGFNRFFGADALTTFGGRVETNLTDHKPHLIRGGIDFGVVPSKYYGANNQCQDSLATLTPSTVFAPSSYPNRDSLGNNMTGVYRGGHWQRYERYLNLDSTRAASYPGVGGRSVGADMDSGYYIGYRDGNRDSNYWVSPPAWPFSGPFIPSGSLPVVVKQGASYAGWADLRPDSGGFNHVDRIREAVMSLDGSSNYGWDPLKALIGIYGGDPSGISSQNDLYIAGYKYLKVPGYYDTSGTINIGAPNITKTRACSWSGPIGDGPDAITQTFSYGGTCSDVSPDGHPSCTGSAAQCAAISDPPACAQTVAGPYYTRDFANCHWNGRQTLPSRTYSGCRWEGDRKQHTFAPREAYSGGTYFYDGHCRGHCDGPDCEHSVGGGANYCIDSSVDSFKPPGGFTMHQVVQSDGTNNIDSGCDNRTDNGPVYYYGGSCIGNYRDPPGTTWTTDTTDACVKTATATQTIGGVDYHDVRTDGGGCSNKVDTTQTCDQRHPGGLCPYLSCANRSNTMGVGGTPYTVFDRAADQEWTMVHDCVADEGSAGPFMTKQPRPFGANGSPYDGRFSSAAGDTTPTGNTLMYDTSGEQRISTAPAYDVYSTNYLNWKYGPKGPNGDPIGRRTRLQIAKDALVQLVQAQNGVRFGLMVFNQIDGSYNTEGGNVAFAMQRMGTNDPTDPGYASAENALALANRKKLADKINSLVATAQTPLSESLYEAYLYFNGAAPRFGNLTTLALNGTTKVTAGCDRKAFTTPGDGSDSSDCLGNGAHAAASGNYRSPMLDLKGSDGLPASCQKNVVVLVSDGGPENDWSANDSIKALRYEKSSTEVISPRTDVNTPTQSTSFNQFVQPDGSPFGPVDVGSTASDGGYVWLDELAYYMANAKVSPASIPGVQSVATYTIGFAGASTAVLQNTASVGRGQYFAAEDPSLLYSKLTGALDAIRSWQPIAGGGSVVPISALNRAENSNNVYLGFFGPSLQTRWDGSLKKYLFSTVTTPGVPGYCGTTPDGDAVSLCMVGQTAVTNDIGESVWNIEWISKRKDPATGLSVSKVNEQALSFWSPSTSTPDGGSARKGGSGQTLMNGRTPANRPIYTFLSGGSANGGSSSTALSDNPLAESNSTITRSLLGNAAMTAAKRATLINFARGGDPTNSSCADAAASTACNTWRDWAHADILHSKPVVFNYTQDQQYAFYLSTDGTLHAVDTVDGSEKWAYTIEEALPLQDTLMADHEGEHTIVTDGSPSIFFDDANRNGLVDASTDRVTLYFGQRRGGSAYYALDITNIDAPKFLWKIVGGMGVAGKGMLCVGSDGCSGQTEYDELGQTWSFPGVGKVRAKLTASAGRPTPVLIVGGGYDPNQDNDPVVAADSMGRALYVIDGYNGSVVKKFDNVNTVNGMSASIPSDVTAVNADLDAQNLLDRVYVGDTAGNLYRFDIDDALSANWTGGRIAQLSDAYALPDTAPNRKILFPPTLVKQRGMQAGALVAFDAVYVGSGDREHPLKSDGTADRLFMIKDKVGVDRDYALNARLSDLVDITHLASAEAYAPLNTASTKGWYYSLPGAGEKAVSMPTVLNNVLRFSTYAPLEYINSCVPPGRGQLYGMDAYSGTPLDGVKYKMLATNPHVFAGFFSQGYIGHAVPIIFNHKLYVLQVTESGQILPGAADIGTIAKVYWYREAER